MKPLILNPPIKDYIWGGTKLREQFGKKSDLERLAESWELSCHKDGMSIIANGEYSGRSLKDFLNENPSALGTKCLPGSSFFTISGSRRLISGTSFFHFSMPSLLYIRPFFSHFHGRKGGRSG